MPKEKEQEKDWVEEMKKGFARWNQINEEGAGDPSWPDGVNMNLVRTHILIDQDHIKKQIAAGKIPDMELPELPPQVDNDYFANEETRKGYIQNFYETVQKLPLFEEFKTFVNEFRKLTATESKGIYMPHTFHCLQRFNWNSPVSCEAAFRPRDCMVMRDFGRKDCMERFLIGYEADKKTIRERLEKIRGILTQRKPVADAPVKRPKSVVAIARPVIKQERKLAEKVLPNGLGVQLSLF